MRQRRLAVFSLIVTALFAGLLASPAQAASVDYVALGDSYSSGLGAPGARGLCMRSAQGYPQQWAHSQDVSSFKTAACVAAETDWVRNVQIWSLNSDTDLVTISIGGNDVGFAGAMITCTVGSTASCLNAVEKGRKYALTRLPGDLDATYADIRRRAPGAEVYVLGYPRLFEETACPGGLSLAKRQRINEAADELGGIIADRASAAGFTFVDVRSAFAGHGICSSSPWINAFALSLKSYHPNAAGYLHGYLPALTAATN